MKQKTTNHNHRILAVFVLCLAGILLLLGKNLSRIDTPSDSAQNEEGRKIEAMLNALAEKQKEDKKLCVLSAEGIDFGAEEGETIISSEDFLAGCEAEDTAVHYSVPGEKLSGGQLYVLKFTMRAKDAAAKVFVNFGGEENYPYYLLTEWQTYYYPSTDGNPIHSIDFSMETQPREGQQIFLTEVSVLGYDKDTTTLSAIPNGTYPLSSEKEIRLKTRETGTGIGSAMDLIGDGKYIYSINDGQMRISRKDASGEYHVISKVKQLGTVRHIEWVNEKTVAVAARENGVWLIDISDKQEPKIISCYESLERANDVCFSGNLMYVASRYYGVEIVDIADLENPRFIRKIAEGKECYRCIVHENYLFVSYWNARSVDIFDLSADEEPKLAATIAVDGFCGEVFIKDHFLYGVTGYNAASLHDGIGTPGYGTGNGLEIYDISDISNPVWCSTMKADGSLKGAGYDDWSVEVCGRYAYFTDCFNGAYIYDIGDPRAPRRVARLITPIGKGSKNYVDFTNKSKLVFPYDPAESILSPAMGLYLDDGAVYIACAYSDIHKYSFDEAVYRKQEISPADYNGKEETKYQDGNISYALEDSDVYAVSMIDDYYVAGTNHGLVLLNKELEPCDTVLTDHAVKDVRVTNDGYIVTAEKVGVGIYEIQEGKIRQCSFIDSEAYQSHVFSVGITDDGNYAIAQSSWHKWEAIDLHNKKNPVFVTQFVTENGEIIDIDDIEAPGLMYYRCIANGTVNGAVGVAGKSNVLWFQSLGSQLKLCSVYKNNLYYETADSAGLDGTNLAVQTAKDGYIVYDPLQGAPDLKKLTNYKIEGVPLQGIVTTRLNRMSVCNPSSGSVWILDISDYKNPILLKNFKVRGTPNAAFIGSDCILIPARHDGLIKVDI